MKQKELPHMISPRRLADENSSVEGPAVATQGTSNIPSSPAAVPNEESLCHALGISLIEAPHTPGLGGKTTQTLSPQYEEEGIIVPNPEADQVDLSMLRGTRAPAPDGRGVIVLDEEDNEDLEALAELVPALRTRVDTQIDEPHGMTMELEEQEAQLENDVTDTPKKQDTIENNDSMNVVDDGSSGIKAKPETAVSKESKVDASHSGSDPGVEVHVDDPVPQCNSANEGEQNLGGFDDVDSVDALNSEQGDTLGSQLGREQKPKSKEYRGMSSSASLSTATQTHEEVRMPMYLPTFKPATGCTNASDFIVRCFVARLRSGITVVKHGRLRWCKSRLRILHIHSDGRSLSWKPAIGEPTSSKRPPKLDLSSCTEVRHAWSPDPLNPMFTGTPILRQKCEAANAHKSFALIFSHRTVDITAVTADQCKVLMEGFSALCFRLQMANLAGRKKETCSNEGAGSTEASATETNTSIQLSPLSPVGSGTRTRGVRKNAHH